jgi:hypothetical protein
MPGFTVPQLEAIERAIASGTLKVRYDGKEVTYQTLTDLIAARNLMRAELQASGALSTPAAPARGVATVTVFSRD